MNGSDKLCRQIHLRGAVGCCPGVVGWIEASIESVLFSED